MNYEVTIKFIRKNDCSPDNVNKIIECIPPAYRSGHTQVNLIQSMFPSKSYTISFKNKEVAEKFRIDLFTYNGNLLQIVKNY